MGQIFCLKNFIIIYHPEMMLRNALLVLLFLLYLGYYDVFPISILVFIIHKRCQGLSTRWFSVRNTEGTEQMRTADRLISHWCGGVHNAH